MTSEIADLNYVTYNVKYAQILTAQYQVALQHIKKSFKESIGGP